MPPFTDSSGRAHTYLRVAVTDRCNLRCVYCMPPGGIEPRGRGEILAFDEIERIAAILARRGVNKVRLTGGEPLVRDGLPELVGRLARIDGIEKVCLTTNGLLLPRFVRGLKSAGLASVNVSLDTLRPERFEAVTGSPRQVDVMAGIDAALDAGFAPLKLNVVVIRGVNEDELADFAEFARTRPVHVRFIEFMPFRFNCWDRGGLVPFPEMLASMGARYRLVPVDGGSARAAVSRDFAIDGFEGRMGFIAPISSPFCSGCSRIRLTADGSVKSCLLSPSEVNVRDALRRGADDEEICAMIGRALLDKPRASMAGEVFDARRNRCMAEIGG